MNKLKILQALNLNEKILISNRRIREWYDYHHGQVYVSFSGGKDSTSLLHLVRSIYPEVPAVFFDTGLEFPEIRDFVKTIDNVIWVKPKMTFKQVLEKYGYPVVSKTVAMAINRYRNAKTEKHRLYRLHGDERGKMGVIPKKWQYLINAPFKISEQCCDIMKKRLGKAADKQYGKPFIGVMAADSNSRLISYNKSGCNAFDTKNPQSRPMMVWVEQDVWDYLEKFKVPYCSIYDSGYQNTGCIFCMFGVHLEPEPNRFQLLKQTHPQLHDYCMNKLGLKEILEYIGVKYE